MYQAVVSVQPNEDFSLAVVFEDGAKGVLDMTPFLNFGVFKQIQDLDQFKRVRIAFDTVEWECGVDLDPEFIRAKCRMMEKTDDS
ncbi:MAG TPA: DUF2442 domain-containing protein [Sedimentisphaerales bacterium]|jgi:hypothetical protein|nr:DUF2442 domain-containing protein [Sedimentisphaerales bacterium]HNU28063.1 DUF2442 domain-containing protein [Sedimentisphaerales bacterium]